MINYSTFCLKEPLHTRLGTPGLEMPETGSGDLLQVRHVLWPLSHGLSTSDHTEVEPPQAGYSRVI